MDPVGIARDNQGRPDPVPASSARFAGPHRSRQYQVACALFGGCSRLNQAGLIANRGATTLS